MDHFGLLDGGTDGEMDRRYDKLAQKTQEVPLSAPLATATAVVLGSRTPEALNLVAVSVDVVRCAVDVV